MRTLRRKTAPRQMRLALFDLDHTLLSGDSDVLWCDFLIAKGLLDAATFAVRNADIESRYRLGTISVEEFSNFYVGTLAGRSPEQWEPMRQDFLSSEILPRLPGRQGPGAQTPGGWRPGGADQRDQSIPDRTHRALP